MSVELRGLRRRRMIGGVGALSGVVMLAVFLAGRMLVPVETPTNRVVEVSVDEVEPVEIEPAQLAVLVYDGEGMRFELRGADQLVGHRMEFSLQPVVMGPIGDAW